MGGHGGLNILPQKRWNVYNYENREKVRQDEEAAAKEEQLKREQARKRDSEFRIEQLRAARGLAPTVQAAAEPEVKESEPQGAPKLGHINLFEGLKVFDVIGGAGEDTPQVQKDGPSKKKKMKKEEPPRVVTAEDEKYRLGYGIAGKGVKLPWYLAKPDNAADLESGKDNDSSGAVKEGTINRGRKTLQELREERLRREKQEKERERALLQKKSRTDEGSSRGRKFFRR